MLDEPTCSSRLVTLTAVEVGTIFMAFCSKAYQCLFLTVSLEINIFPLKGKKNHIYLNYLEVYEYMFSLCVYIIHLLHKVSIMEVASTL